MVVVSESQTIRAIRAHGERLAGAVGVNKFHMQAPKSGKSKTGRFRSPLKDIECV
jgi:hypothetical protein